MVDPIIYQAQETVLIDYVDLLGRLPDTAGTNYWSDLLLTKNWTTQQVAGAISFSPEGIVAQQTQDVTSLYLALFARVPDVAGLKYWTDVYHQGAMSLNQIANVFLNSAEGKAIYPSTMSNAEAVTKLYSTLFLTQPTAEKVDSYVNALNSGWSFSSLATSLASEYKTGSLTNPVDTLQNQVFLNFLQATHVGDPSYDAANSTFHLPDGGIYDIPSVLSVAPPSVKTSNSSLDAATIGSTAKTYVGTPNNDTWQFDKSTWNDGNTFDGKAGYDQIVLKFNPTVFNGNAYNISGSNLNSIEGLYVDFDPVFNTLTTVNLTQGFQTDGNTSLNVWADSMNSFYHFNLIHYRALFNQKQEKTASDVNAAGEWFLQTTENGFRKLSQLTYYDEVNYRVQKIDLQVNDSIPVVKVVGGDITFSDL